MLPTALVTVIVCLLRIMTVDQAKAEFAPADDASGFPSGSFDFCNRQWKELITSMREGDELWEFTSSPASWDGRCGRAGLTLLRNGEEVACVFTAIS